LNRYKSPNSCRNHLWYYDVQLLVMQ